MTAVPAGAGIDERAGGQVGQAEGVQFTMQEQPPSELIEESRNASVTERRIGAAGGRYSPHPLGSPPPCHAATVNALIS